MFVTFSRYLWLKVCVCVCVYNFIRFQYHFLISFLIIFIFGLSQNEMKGKISLQNVQFLKFNAQIIITAVHTYICTRTNTCISDYSTEMFHSTDTHCVLGIHCMCVRDAETERFHCKHWSARVLVGSNQHTCTIQMNTLLMLWPSYGFFAFTCIFGCSFHLVLFFFSKWILRLHNALVYTEHRAHMLHDTCYMRIKTKIPLLFDIFCLWEQLKLWIFFEEDQSCWLKMQCVYVECIQII